MDEIQNRRLSELEDRLRFLAVQKTVPLLNGIKPYPDDAADDVHGNIMVTLWDHGFVPVAQDLALEGVSASDLQIILERVCPVQRRAPPLDYELSDESSARLEAELAEAWETDTALEYITERTSKLVKEFKVMFRSDENKHRGRPHIVAVINGLEVSISLDETPKVLAPKRKIRGIAAALKVISKHRNELVKEWNESRPDDQKL